MSDLFWQSDDHHQVKMAEGAVLLPRFANGEELHQLILDIAAKAPFRHFTTRSGFALSVAMTNCGEKGWVSDRRGYRYEPVDPLTNEPWPQMPDEFLKLAQMAAKAGGFDAFTPNACLINRYEPGTKMGLHQDKDERDFSQPIVSVSIGLTARFQFGGLERSDPVAKYELQHGDVVVWGGPSRLFYHGIMPLKVGNHPATGTNRYNLTFRYTG